MSLDFVTLGQDGTPENTVPLGVDLHHALLAAATSRGFPSFQSFKDYYEDAEIAVTELPLLREQVQTLKSQALSPALRRFLDDLTELIKHAMTYRKPIYVIAD
jgi:hypothetical protein